MKKIKITDTDTSFDKIKKSIINFINRYNFYKPAGYVFQFEDDKRVFFNLGSSSARKANIFWQALEKHSKKSIKKFNTKVESVDIYNNCRFKYDNEINYTNNFLPVKSNFGFEENTYTYARYVLWLIEPPIAEPPIAEPTIKPTTSTLSVEFYFFNLDNNTKDYFNSTIVDAFVIHKKSFF